MFPMLLYNASLITFMSSFLVMLQHTHCISILIKKYCLDISLMLLIEVIKFFMLEEIRRLTVSFKTPAICLDILYAGVICKFIISQIWLFNLHTYIHIYIHRSNIHVSGIGYGNCEDTELWMAGALECKSLNFHFSSPFINLLFWFENFLICFEKYKLNLC
jgi:hypothetical protein